MQPKKKKKFKSKAKTGRKYLQHIYPIKDLYPDSIKNVYNALTRRQPEFFFFKKRANDLSRQFCKEEIQQTSQ